MQEILTIAAIVAAVAYVVIGIVRRLRNPGDCGCGKGRNCPYKNRQERHGDASCPHCGDGRSA